MDLKKEKLEQSEQSGYKPRFQLGDVVRVVDYIGNDKSGWKYLAMTGKVVEVIPACPREGRPESVDVDNGLNTYKFLPCELELIEASSFKPKFNIGDKVRVLAKSKFGRVDRIFDYNKYNDTYRIECSQLWFEPNELEPFTELEPKENKPMEEKELNLCELLKGCKGERIYLPDDGWRTIFEVKDDEIILKEGEKIGTIHLVGENLTSTATGFAYAYPSEESFRKYPLDAKKAWQEWEENRKPKYELNIRYGIHGNQNDDEVGQFNPFNFGSLEEAQEAVNEIQALLETFHNRKEGKK